jgi:hypothetical protein
MHSEIHDIQFIFHTHTERLAVRVIFWIQKAGKKRKRDIIHLRALKFRKTLSSLWVFHARSITVLFSYKGNCVDGRAKSTPSV